MQQKVWNVECLSMDYRSLRLPDSLLCYWWLCLLDDIRLINR